MGGNNKKLLGAIEANLKNVSEDIKEIRTETKKISGLETNLTNHLKHHEKWDKRVFAMFLVALGVFLSSLAIAVKVLV